MSFYAMGGSFIYHTGDQIQQLGLVLLPLWRHCAAFNGTSVRPGPYEFDHHVHNCAVRVENEHLGNADQYR